MHLARLTRPRTVRDRATDRCQTRSAQVRADDWPQRRLGKRRDVVEGLRRARSAPGAGRSNRHASVAELHPLVRATRTRDGAGHTATSRVPGLRETPRFRMDPMFWMSRRRDFIHQATRPTSEAEPGLRNVTVSAGSRASLRQNALHRAVTRSAVVRGSQIPGF
jgi:hypothetical protein